MVAPAKGAGIVVDSGYSNTYVVPFFEGMPMKHCATRIDVGGKLLTNLLMEQLSFKEVNLQGEFGIVQQIKESCCFVSDRFQQDMEVARLGGLQKEFVLPDYKTLKKGFIAQTPEDALIEGVQHQSIKIKTERFTVPEVLFTPSDIGIN